jgi:hypothetical protein
MLMMSEVDLTCPNPAQESLSRNNSISVGKSHRDAFDHSEMHQRIRIFNQERLSRIPQPVKASFVPLMKNDEFARVATCRKSGGTLIAPQHPAFGSRLEALVPDFTQSSSLVRNRPK